ncbi:hypothetical protein SASPL_108792 [Salvia splendens]|uniref:Reverse transcriptase Ty1/copia-type domain-containing protein n=1 Tax=Salvia splendens TaxID=180675 RepID=A0A8X8YF39_SALSN|nr:hypothetical protein SASPL_108792 [Salvia splendens]
MAAISFAPHSSGFTGSSNPHQQRSVNIVEDTANIPSIDQYQHLISLLQSQKLHNPSTQANTPVNDPPAQSSTNAHVSNNFSGWVLAMQDELQALIRNNTWMITYLPLGKLVCRLKKSHYDLKQASRQWYLKFSQVLSGFGLVQSASDHSFFYKSSSTGHFFGVVIYVDDILVASSNPKYFLGIEIARNKIGIFISQHKYALDLVSDAGLLGCKPASTPMDSMKHLQMDARPPLDDPAVYRRLISVLVYLCITRPNITFAINKLSQFLSKPCSEHLLAA